MPQSPKGTESPRDALKGTWLGRFLENDSAEKSDKANVSMTATLSLQGLSPRDAVDIVDKKIKRALLSGIEQLRILFVPEEVKVKKALLNYLSQSATVKSFEDDTDRDDQIWIMLTKRT